MRTWRRAFRLLITIVIMALLVTGGMTALAAGGMELTPSYEIKSGMDNMADFTVFNSDTAKHTYVLQAANVPDGISWYFTVASQKATEVTLQSSSSAVVTLHLTLPDTAASTMAQIKVIAKRDDGIIANVTVNFSKNSDYALKITKTSDSLKTVAGETLVFDIAVTNTGDKELTGIALNLILPYKWLNIGVNPDTLSLKPGESSTFQISVQPPASQSAGMSTITISAGNAKAASGDLAIPVKVTSNMNFVWVLGGVAVIIVAVAFIYFRRHGRR